MIRHGQYRSTCRRDGSTTSDQMVYTKWKQNYLYIPIELLIFVFTLKYKSLQKFKNIIDN